MGQLLSRAFWLRIPIPGMGGVPVNALFVLGCAILGIGNPGFWLLGLAAEAAYLSFLVFNPRFQKILLAEATYKQHQSEAELRDSLFSKLSPVRRERLGKVRQNLSKLQALRRHESRSNQLDLFDAASGVGYDQIEWAFLKLLIAQEHLANLSTSPAPIEAEIEKLTAELQNTGMSDGLRNSKSSMLDVLTQRLENIKRRGERQEEIESNLHRIEQQVELAIENVSIRGGDSVSSFEIDLAFLDSQSYGDSLGAIEQIDTRIGHR